jgi:hypothetical protein
LELLHARIRELTHGAEPSSGDPANAPGVAHTPHGSPVKEATAADPAPPSPRARPDSSGSQCWPSACLTVAAATSTSARTPQIGC